MGRNFAALCGKLPKGTVGGQQLISDSTRFHHYVGCADTGQRSFDIGVHSVTTP
ncbi:hypothetical protein SDC9_88112 [bioreactor metagenome]|uniref:Uncharacterized protein n=1 Tax=bioreactor metagenome TaxID=1076179 RepID=A0A644ZL61_9ZZZZ